MKIKSIMATLTSKQVQQKLQAITLTYIIHCLFTQRHLFSKRDDFTKDTYDVTQVLSYARGCWKSFRDHYFACETPQQYAKLLEAVEKRLSSTAKRPDYMTK